MFHGHGPDSTGGAGPQHNGDWLVQALPDLVHGGSKDGAANPPLLPDVPGEHHWSVLRATVSQLLCAVSGLPGGAGGGGPGADL